MFFRAPSVCYEEVFVVKDRQDWAALSKIEHDWQSSSFFSLHHMGRDTFLIRIKLFT